MWRSNILEYFLPIFFQAGNASFHNPRPFQSNLDTNTIPGTPECKIQPDGKVNCPIQIYHDRKSWRRSRHQVENEIQQLKEKLEKLKEIRRHLKHSKPLEGDEEEVANVTESVDSIGFNQVHVNLLPNYNIYPMQVEISDNVTTKRAHDASSTTHGHPKRKKINEENQRQSKRRRIKFDSDSDSDNITNTDASTTSKSSTVLNELTTRSPLSNTSHHRHHHHHHKHHTTTTNYSEAVSPTTENSITTRRSVTNGPFGYTTIHKVSSLEEHRGVPLRVLVYVVFSQSWEQFKPPELLWRPLLFIKKNTANAKRKSVTDRIPKKQPRKPGGGYAKSG